MMLRNYIHCFAMWGVGIALGILAGIMAMP